MKMNNEKIEIGIVVVGENGLELNLNLAYVDEDIEKELQEIADRLQDVVIKSIEKYNEDIEFKK